MPADMSPASRAMLPPAGPRGSAAGGRHIELLKQSLPGGMLLIGEPWWRKRPATAEEAIACGAQSPDDFLTLPALVAHFGELGYDVVEMVLADRGLIVMKRRNG